MTAEITKQETKMDFGKGGCVTLHGGKGYIGLIRMLLLLSSMGFGAWTASQFIIKATCPEPTIHTGTVYIQDDCKGYVNFPAGLGEGGKFYYIAPEYTTGEVLRLLCEQMKCEKARSSYFNLGCNPNARN